MRWIDISLPPTGTCPETDRQLDEARSQTEAIPEIQERHGLDTPAVTSAMEQIGRLLFAAITAHDVEALSPDPDRPGAPSPADDPDTEEDNAWDST